MKCFYHNDLDGQASAFCVYAWAGLHHPEQHSEFRPINYDEVFPLDSIQDGEQVWIVDYSISPDEMLALLKITTDVTWIDHHKTAINKYLDFEIPIRGVREDGVAACVLTWKYLHWWSSRGSGPIDLRANKSKVFPVPRMIELIGDRDVWDWKYGETTAFFHSGAGLHDTDPLSTFWFSCMDHETEDLPLPNTGNRDARLKGLVFWEQLLRDGQTVEKYKEQNDSKMNSSLGFECSFEGRPCWAINRPYIGSDRIGNRLCKYDIILPFYFNGEKFVVSLRSNVVDVSEIALRHGGGGHKGAAGFVCSELPFHKKV